MDKNNKIKIKKGQKWQCTKDGHFIVVGTKIRDNCWAVHPGGNTNSIHKMVEDSFHFYKLIIE